ncbi:zona pellucida-like domain-containing protein 1 [Pelmatolapia mariae]|uniref:zona pellucida-like domain-containing protein 1 n=1 Tax=Pelmatolapia mariae TaxID=158779 RepID=UPI002FE5D325
MDKIKELSTNIREKIVDLHMTGMSCNTISKKVGQLHHIDRPVDESMYHKILDENLLPSARTPKVFMDVSSHQSSRKSVEEADKHDSESFCEEEFAKILPEICANLVTNYKKCLLCWTCRSSLKTMKLLILLFQLGLVLRADAQIPDACILSSTNRAPEKSDVSVTCGPEHIDLSIYLCPMYNAFYNESLVVLNNQTNNPKCYGTADFTVDPPRLRFSFPINQNSLSFCSNNIEISSHIGSGQFSDFSYVQYVTVFGTVTSIDPAAGMITYRPQIRYNFSCTYRMNYLFNNTELSVSGGTSSIKSNDGRLFNMLSMQLYKDKQYQEILTIPETGLEVKTKIYVEVKAINLKNRFNVLLERCFATTSPNPMQSGHYGLFVWYTRDAQTMVETNGVSQKALFSFEAFRLVDNEYETVSTFYLHCVTRLCEVSKCRSLLSKFGSSERLCKKKANKYVSESTIVTSPAIHVRSQRRKAVTLVLSNIDSVRESLMMTQS